MVEGKNINDLKLIDIVKNGNIEKLKKVMDFKTNLDIIDDNGNGLLLIAIKKGFTNIVQFLIDQGIDVNLSNNIGWTPLMEAVQMGNIEIVKSLVECGADTNAEDMLGNSAESIIFENNNIELLKFINNIESYREAAPASAGAIDLDHLDNLFESKNNSINNDVIIIFDDSSADKDNIVADSAIENYGDAVVKETDNLPSYVFDFDTQDEKNDDSNIGKISLEELDSLLNSDNEPASEIDNEMSNMSASDSINEDNIIEVDPSVSKDSKQNGFIDVDNLKVCGVENTVISNSKVKTGKNKVGSEIKNGNLKKVTGGKLTIEINRFDYFPVDKIASIDVDDIKTYVRNTSNVVNISREVESKNKKNAELRKALLSENVNKTKTLLKGGADPNILVEDGKSLLMLAILSDNLNLVKALISAKVNINQVDKLGNSALFYAVKMSNIAIVKAILSAKPNVNIKNNNWSTPLMIAASQGNFDIVKLLVKTKADITCKDRDGEDVFKYIGNGKDSKKIVKFLRLELGKVKRVSIK